MLHNLIEAIKVLKSGRPVIILDDYNRENEGDLVVAAELVTEYSINFMVKHSSGVICLATTPEQLNRLKLTKISSLNHKVDKFATPFALSCEASSNIGTGISASDRSVSIKVIGNPNAKPEDIVVPGHIFPLSSHSEGLKGREGHTEASVELCKIANLWPSAAIAEVTDENGELLRSKNLDIFAKTYNIPIVTISEIKQVVNSGSTSYVVKTAEARLPTEYGEFNIHIWQNLINFEENIVLIKGDVKSKENVPVRIHSQCLTGDVFHSLKCDCGDQLSVSLKYISSKGLGILIWLRQEGRGIGLTNKIKAYNLQDTLGLDTVEANLRLNLPVDARTFNEAIDIINYYSPSSIELLTNNPQKISEIVAASNAKVMRKDLIVEFKKENINYLRVKQTKLNHLLNIKDDK